MTAPTRFRLFAGAGSALAIAVVATGLLLGSSPTEAQQAAPAPAAPAAAAPAAKEPGGGIVATINGEAITEGDLDIAYDEFAQQLQGFGLDRRREVAIDLLIHIRLLAKQAEKQGIDKEEEMAHKLRLVRERALYGEVLNRLFMDAVTETAAHKLFDEQQAKTGAPFEYHVRHILVPTMKEAVDIIAKLDNGGDFAQLAKDESIDAGSAPDGGDLGFIAAGDTVKEFETAAFALDVGKYTKTPIESQFGFHVIRLEEKKEGAPKTFESSIPELQDQLAQIAFQKLIDDLEKGATIVKAPPPGQQPALPTPSGPATAIPPR